MSDEAVAVVQEALELYLSGDTDAAIQIWAEDSVAIPPRLWPESQPLVGRKAIREQFESWDEVFGSDWRAKMSVERLTGLDDDRVLGELNFEPSGAASGVPLQGDLASIYTVRDGKIARTEFFMSHAEARAAAGIG